MIESEKPSRPTREQLLKSIRELTPDEEELALAIEKRLASPSGWKHRDAARAWADDASSMHIEVERSIENKEWLHLAWEIIDIVKEAKKINDLFGVTDE